MAIRPDTEAKFVGRVNAPSGQYPYGSAKPETTAGVTNDGTPFVTEMVNDTWGFLQRLLSEAGIVPSGNPDNVSVSQYFQALESSGILSLSAIGKDGITQTNDGTSNLILESGGIQFQQTSAPATVFSVLNRFGFRVFQGSLFTWIKPDKIEQTANAVTQSTAISLIKLDAPSSLWITPSAGVYTWTAATTLQRINTGIPWRRRIASASVSWLDSSGTEPIVITAPALIRTIKRAGPPDLMDVLHIRIPSSNDPIGTDTSSRRLHIQYDANDQVT